MFAVIKTSGRQYRVQEGSVIKVDRVGGSVGDTLLFDDEVVALGDESSLRVDGLQSVSVGAVILEQTRDDKIVVFKKKRRKGYQKKQGHRQDMTVLKIDSIRS